MDQVVAGQKAAGRPIVVRRLAKAAREAGCQIIYLGGALVALVKDTLAALSRAAEGDDNLMHRLIDCANAYCTVGEMVSALKSVWGEFQQPAVF